LKTKTRKFEMDMKMKNCDDVMDHQYTLTKDNGRDVTKLMLHFALFLFLVSKTTVK